MPFKFNPFSGTFDQTGSGTSSSGPIDGEVPTYSDLSLDVSVAPLNSSWLVRTASGSWFTGGSKPAGIYVRTGIVGSSRDADFTYAGLLPSAFADSDFKLYNNATPSKALQFDLSGISASTTRTLTVPNASGTLVLSNDARIATIGSGTINTSLTPGQEDQDPGPAGTISTYSDYGLQSGGYISTIAGPLSNGGYIDTRGGGGADGHGGYINTSGVAEFRGGYINTSGGGGNINTRGQGFIELGEAAGDGLQTRLVGSCTGAIKTITLPNATGTVALTSDFAAPPAIGNTTRNSGAFTTLNATNGTVTASAPVLDLAQTWNNSAVAFTGFRINVTNTGNAPVTSLIADWQVGGISMFYVRRDGRTIGAGGVYGANGLEAGLLSQGVVAGSASYIGLCSATAATDATCDTRLFRDAANALAQRNGTNSQESRLYGTFTSSTNYQRMTVKSVKQTLSALSGASATTTGTFIPDGAVVVGVTTRVATLLTGATGYTIGDGTDADRWGDITGTAVGTTADNRDWTAGTIECFTAGGNITLTAKTSNFTAGAVEICVFYLAGEAD
jgi:hypothetical protein